MGPVVPPSFAQGLKKDKASLAKLATKHRALHRREEGVVCVCVGGGTGSSGVISGAAINKGKSTK